MTKKGKIVFIVSMIAVLCFLVFTIGCGGCACACGV